MGNIDQSRSPHQYSQTHRVSYKSPSRYFAIRSREQSPRHSNASESYRHIRSKSREDRVRAPYAGDDRNIADHANYTTDARDRTASYHNLDRIKSRSRSPIEYNTSNYRSRNRSFVPSSYEVSKQTRDKSGSAFGDTKYAEDRHSRQSYRNNARKLDQYRERL